MNNDWTEIMFRDETKGLKTCYILKMEFKEIPSKYKLRLCYNKWIAEEKKVWRGKDWDKCKWSVKKWEQLVVENITTTDADDEQDLFPPEIMLEKFIKKIDDTLFMLEIDHYEDGDLIFKSEPCVLHKSKK
jgi:hypothetical protein